VREIPFSLIRNGLDIDFSSDVILGELYGGMQSSSTKRIYQFFIVLLPDAKNLEGKERTLSTFALKI